MLCACSIFIFSAFCLCLPDNMDILPRRRALSRARSLLPERWRYPVEAATQGGAEDARARIGHACPLAGVDDAAAAFRPVPGLGGGQRAGSTAVKPCTRGSPTPLTVNGLIAEGIKRETLSFSSVVVARE